MLVISRKIEEKIRIDDQISIVVLEIEGQRVKLGIEAPKEVAIYRQELYDEIQVENRLAGSQNVETSLLKQLMSHFLKKN